MTAATDPVSVAAVVVAAGSGARLGAQVPKAFVEVAGRTLLAHSVTAMVADPRVMQVVVVAPDGWTDAAGDGLEGGRRVDVVVGGATRQESVAAGLAAVRPEVGIVLVHDAARPFVPPAVVDAVVAAIAGGADAAVPVVPVVDTVRRVLPDGTLAGVVDRSTLVAVQTPQGFRRDVLDRAHASATAAVTDDAALIEALGGVVVAVPGSDEAFKVTTRADLARAAALAGLRSRP